MVDRVGGIDRKGEPGFCTDEVNLSKEMVGMDEHVYLRPDNCGKFNEDSYDLAPFGIVEFPDLVVGLENFGRFNVNRVPGGRFIVNESLDLAFVGADHGDDQPAVPDGHFSFIRCPSILPRQFKTLNDFMFN